MRAHLKYLSYVLRHKWFVFLAGLKLGVPFVALITHDWSKFLPSEWGPYVRYFYGNFPEFPDGVLVPKMFTREWVQPAFDVAWNHHQKRQPHHWQYWLLTFDHGGTVALPMPDRFAREMVADWHGAGRALGKDDTVGWYLANCEKMILHPDTRRQVENLLRIPYTHLVEQEHR
jgi:uncharacterized protein DUF5662